MYSIALNFNLLPKSLNKKLRGGSRFRNVRENHSWDMLVGSEVCGVRPVKPLEKAKIYICRYSHRTLDYDGLVGSMKPVIDSLVTHGILKDDSWTVTGQWIVDQKFRPKASGPLLTVFIKEVETLQK